VPLRGLGIAIGLGCWLVAVVTAGMSRFSPVAHSVTLSVLVLAGTILIFLSALGTPSHLIPSWLTYCGKISYGLYLFHCLVFFLVFKIADEMSGPKRFSAPGSRALVKALEVAISLAITLGLAHLSYKYFESFFLRLKQHFTFVATRD
jgi:peptidoglycan/LPS O-acetylase OafA/YrhL